MPKKAAEKEPVTPGGSVPPSPGGSGAVLAAINALTRQFAESDAWVEARLAAIEGTATAAAAALTAEAAAEPAAAEGPAAEGAAAGPVVDPERPADAAGVVGGAAGGVQLSDLTVEQLQALIVDSVADAGTKTGVTDPIPHSRSGHRLPQRRYDAQEAGQRERLPELLSE